ncbi:MAG: helix-turn-helix domain-containing protein [Gemmatimonadaceae bacterium]
MDSPRLRYVEHQVPAALRSCVRAFWHLTGERTDEAGASHIVPDGCVELVFNVGDPMQEDLGYQAHLQPRALVVGQLLRPTTITPTGQMDLWGVRLQPWAAHQVLDVNARDLRDSMVPLDLFGVRRRSALGAVFECGGDAARLEALTRALYELTDGATGPSPADRRLIRWAADANTTSVRSLARAAGWSARRIEMLFDRHVGLAPKSLLRLWRFQRALALLRASTPLGMGRIAAQCGYHDHAHFVRECRQFAGVTPSAVATNPDHMGDAFIDR